MHHTEDNNSRLVKYMMFKNISYINKIIILFTWMLKSFKVLIISYKRPLWSWQTIWTSVWAGLRELSIVMETLSKGRDPLCCWSSIFDLSMSSVISGGRNVGLWEHAVISGPTISMSQLIMESPKTAFKLSYVSSCLFFVCSSSLIRQFRIAIKS